MIASVLPDWVVDYGTDLVFIAATMAAIVYVIKRVIGFLQKAKDEVTEDDDS